MRVLVLGSGGREHAIGWKIKKDEPAVELFFAPGNGGTEKIGQSVSINPENPKDVRAICSELKIDFVVVGPENPLAKGVADELESAGIPCFGTKKDAAKIEASKSYAKKLMEKAGIPTAKYTTYTEEDFKSGRISSEKLSPPIVIKATGLCAGKGTFVCKTQDDISQALERIFVKREFGDEGKEIIVEELLEGREISYFALCSQNKFTSIGFARDYKRLLDGDRGPNTGGMGSYSPVEYGDEELLKKVERKIVQPLMETLEEDGIQYTGILYVGIMLVDGEPFVLEFNVRLGDPEAQVILPRMSDNFLELCTNAVDGKIPDKVRMSKHALCVVMASEGYPGKYKKGVEIKIPDEFEEREFDEEDDFIIFHAGTKMEDGKILTAGGRVLGVVGLGNTKESARKNAYNVVENIKFEGAQYRKDIGE